MIRFGFPNIKEPFIDPRSGQISRTWWLFLQSIFTQVGSGNTPDLTDINNRLNALQDDVNELGDEVSQVDAHVNDVDTLVQGVAPAALFGALLLRIASLEVQLASVAPASSPRRHDDLAPVATTVKARRIADLETMVNQ